MSEKNLIMKAAQVEANELTDSDLQKINQYTIAELAADDVFTFRAVLCDNEIDRTFEHFSDDALKAMADSFVGRTVIRDHEWKSENQVARIYDAYVVNGKGNNLLDKQYKQLIAACYMVKTESNADLIAEIKGGIKKEGSVGLRIGGCVCSICGTDAVKSYCPHWAGETYDDELCTYELTGPVDALEFSLVAVPAQPAAGVSKSYHEDLKAAYDKAEAEKAEQKRIDDECEALAVELELLKL